MDYKKIAIRIASSEDPYGEFSKEASDLDELHATSLAREVNKQFFLSRLENRNGDGNIDFNVIVPSQVDNCDVVNNSDTVVEKTASEISTIDKSTLVDSSMFVLEKTSSSKLKAKSFNNGTGSILMKFAEHNINSELDNIKEKEEADFNNDKIRAIAVLNDMFGAEVENLTKIANDASELRYVIGKVIDSNLENIIPEIIAITPSAQSEIIKVASVKIGEDRNHLVDSHILNIQDILEAKALVKKAENSSDLEKIAFITSAIGGAARLGFNALKTIGKGALGTAKMPGRVSGAIKNAAKLKNPIKGFKEGGGLIPAAGTALVAGTTALAFPGKVDKYQNVVERL